MIGLQEFLDSNVNRELIFNRPQLLRRVRYLLTCEYHNDNIHYVLHISTNLNLSQGPCSMLVLDISIASSPVTNVVEEVDWKV